MKTRSLPAICLLLLWAAAPIVAEEAKNPDIDIPERIFDAGEVMKGEKINHVFKVKNTGDAPLQIFSAKPSCGCTVTDYDRTILPGQVGKVTAIIDTSRLHSGSQTKSVTISSNDPDEKQLILQLKGTVVTLADTFPASVYIRGQRGALSVAPLIVRGHEKNPFEVKAVSSDVGFLSFKISEVAESDEPARPTNLPNRAKKGDYRIDIEIDESDLPIGDVNGTLKVLTTSKQTPELSVPVRGTIMGLIQTIPRRVYLRVTSPPEYVTANEASLKLRREPNIEAPEVAEVGKGEHLQLLKMPGNVDPEGKWLRVRTRDMRLGYVFADLVSEVESEAGATKMATTRTLRVTKKEGDPFDLKKVECTVEGVTVETNTVEEGRTYSITLTYDGKLNRGTHQGELVLTTSDKEEPTVHVPLYVQIQA